MARAAIQQIRDEHNHISMVKEIMCRSTISAADRLYRDSLTARFMQCTQSVHGFDNSLTLEEELLQQRRRREERTSLLSGQYQADKYPEEASHHLLSDPTVIPDRPYVGGDGDVEMADETGGPTANEQAKKKKRKKNKKKKNKGLEPEAAKKEEEKPIELQEIVVVEEEPKET